ncbi:Glutathione synthetase large chain [Colletotrichum orbiculare MAFF 240422]|uniref:Glutathione synthetase n=1 Tax=Colletotrichum orbiculare (strain 104-T / ATCC 96160 / CBS 514.97 / LARS 414 / MAFF 240422) TaxID=1213857 RepID=N4V3K6_COLOR|nr:Glutathione synthetase large chain [Colletotrichum orbiculare MAFF 240422]
MATSTLAEGRYPPQLSQSEQAALVQAIKDWAIGNGLSVRPPPALVPAEADPKGVLAVNVPVTLFPSPFPGQCFTQARSVQKAYNELYAAISRDEKFLSDMVNEVKGGDDFISKLWDTHVRVKNEGYTQDLSLGLFRSDYLVHQDNSSGEARHQVKQVEFNTIAASFGGLSSRTSLLHKFLSTTEYPLLSRPIGSGTLSLPENQSVQGLGGGIRAAFDQYGPSELGHKKCVIFVVQGGERNIFDQRHLEYALASSPDLVQVFRIPFSELLQHTEVANTEKRQLLYKVPRDPSKVFEVAVAYLRCWYDPSDYPDESAWEARYQLERSSAIKCPTVLTQLAGSKKIQQVLATPRSGSAPSVLGRFIPDDAPQTAEVWQTFTNIFPMDTSEAGLRAREIARDPELCKKYVLKPQREGGGNNHYREDIPEFLKKTPESHWGSYILMELITPPKQENIILRNGNLEEGGVICELGIYGTTVWKQSTGEVIHNEEAGYLLRTKGDTSNEGGVAAGFGCMDSCTLV